MYKLDKIAYLACVLRKNPWELLHLAGVGLNTFTCRYVRRCVGRGTVVGKRTVIVNSANVQIGDHCLLQDGVYIRAGTDGKIIIKDRVAINSFCRLFGHGGIIIGEDTQIGPGSLITTTTHDYDDDLESAFKEVIIGKGVWIGASVTIVPGVSIGDYAVIGAGSLVTKDVDSHVLAVGVPAREIRRLHEPPKSGAVTRMAVHDAGFPSIS